MQPTTRAENGSWPGAAAGSVARVQGGFYVLTGMWPLLHGRSFLAVTGPKVDFWLAQTVGLLLAVTGAALWCAARRGRIGPEWALLAAGQAGGLAAVDVIFVTRGRISPIYLADAVAELLLVAAWIVVARRARAASRA